MFTLLNKTSPSESSTGAVYSTFRQRLNSLSIISSQFLQWLGRECENCVVKVRSAETVFLLFRD